MLLYKDVCLIGIKVLNIGWATLAYYLMTIASLYLLHLIYGTFDENKYKHVSLFELNASMLLYLWVIGIFIYIARNLFPLFPFPLDGYMGYDHYKVKEVTSASLFSIFIVIFNNRLQGYYTLIKDRIFGFH